LQSGIIERDTETLHGIVSSDLFVLSVISLCYSYLSYIFSKNALRHSLTVRATVVNSCLVVWVLVKHLQNSCGYRMATVSTL